MEGLQGFLDQLKASIAGNMPTTTSQEASCPFNKCDGSMWKVVQLPGKGSSEVRCECYDFKLFQLSISDKCPHRECDGSGWTLFLDEENGVCRRKECKCLIQENEQRRLDKLFKIARIPAKYLDKRLENYEAAPGSEQHTAWRMAKRYVERFQELRSEEKNGLFMFGNPGTGKSHLSYAILQEMMRQGVAGICATVPDLMESLRPGGDESQDTKKMLEALKTMDLLILDDLGACKSTPWVTERVYIILNARASNNLPTIITSNEDLDTLESLPGWDRIVSRILGMTHVVPVHGDDYRKKK
ncbi:MULTISPECIES: ATP-binding protein [Brevibacillus]|uniref:DNA replication protein DnaC n=2 Tax=Brevibacillus TaxID=55080 RepID=A0A1I3M1X6_9BACL|nr:MULTISPECIES: ATP-binding protein [Brevibacillus]PSJ66948.1 ATP-binding protein [Brevibacillus brevis]RED27777.1 DNA replication protein DnaC [Brevibacillus brevis]TQK42143.1 DNA replication protein DnaC [Brevibacillus sp. AG162]SFI90927.1 DNA replication protein DnaC [Brevibacillus centrosporus]VEF86815.1 DNA replication protein dnaC [Brevibacillus brevis]